MSKIIYDFLSKNKRLDAILFGTSRIGICGLLAINRLGLKVPDDLAIISYDDYEVFQLHSPLVSAIAQPIEGIADHVITLLLNRLNGKLKADEKQTITISTVLNIRDSSTKKL
ncbi:MAG: LacI family transcriptional regulator [Mucilaginibacter sp.]|uniref:substrate-binding domain-containing protein n=1 Tax=Mucilaginibacter sp. TaxID=1882438 RepID=UPI0026191DBA|nr:substrate-binding domain-containing protein [Mucilaginibacter sp.]MDB5002510.1 LacI family transcriptional regulator [Mucilaginibacter sp.]